MARMMLKQDVRTIIIEQNKLVPEKANVLFLECRYQNRTMLTEDIVIVKEVDPIG